MSSKMIGRELYTAPKNVFINLIEGEFTEKDGRIFPRVRFDVKEIAYNDERQIIKLIIIDSKGNVRYSFGEEKKASEKKKTPEKKKEAVVYTSDNGKTITEGDATWERAAQSVADGKTCKDGTPIAVWLADFYHLPKDVMTRFLSRVSELTKAA